jgi:hypothetical protein
MKVSKTYLENKIQELNDWILVNEIKENSIKTNRHIEYTHKKRSRDYYVNKLIELEENQLTSIKV